MSSWKDLGEDSPNRRRGWLEEGGWWRERRSWGIKVKFTERAREIFFGRDYQSDLQLRDAVKYVKHVERSQQPGQQDKLGIGIREGIEVLFDALELTKSSILESINVDLTSADVAKLEKAIKSGCLQSLKHLRIHTGTQYGLLTLANAMASHGLPSLQTLILNGVELDHDGFKAYGIALASGKLPKLSCLQILGNGFISNEGPKSVGLAFRSGNSKNLAIGITHEGLTALVDCFKEGVPSLSWVQLSFLPDLGLDSFTEVGLLSLVEALSSGKLLNLTYLDISGNDIGVEGAKSLGLAIRSGELKNLAELKLNGVGLTDEGVIALTDSFQKGVANLLPKLSSLDIGRNSFTKVGLLSLVLPLRSGKLPNLSCLDVSGNAFIYDLNDWGAKSIGLAIRSSTSKKLAIGISKEGLIAVVDSFQDGLAGMLPDLSSGELSNLIYLDLSVNDIGVEGAKSLGLAIRSGELNNLAELKLNSISLTDEGLIALTDFFQEGVASLLPKLSFLDLSFNSFTEVGLLSLGEALKSGHLNSLKALDVQYSLLPSKEGARALVSAFLTNNCLTVDVKFEWYKFPDLDRRREQLIERNHRNKDILAGLVTVPKVKATFGKVYLCGNPEVGKTTLRRTLQKSFWKSLFTWERRPRVEKRTRGIDVSQLSSTGIKPDEDPITLLVWDMAGQEDFHLVHNAFFPDLGFAEGKATTFIVVCSSKHTQHDSIEQLGYWLRYVASSCDRTVQNPRQVFVVMNKFGGGPKRRVGQLAARLAKFGIPEDAAALHAEQYWKLVLEDKRDKFEQHLEIQTKLFRLDVRRFKHVDRLKCCLLEHSRSLLRNQEVPNVCHAIQENLSVLRQQREEFPVLHWTEFLKQVEDLVQEYWPEQIIEAATKYLNEAGVMIYIDVEGVRLVVVDPNWLCTEIIGKVFLPRVMASPRELLFREQVDQSTGSISIPNFKRFFKSLKGLWNDAQVDDMIAILLWLGLCYKGKDENVFIPALIDEEGKPGDPWCGRATVVRGGDQWVMGFSVRHQKNEVALAPISLWHRFQVDLAQSPKFNGQRRRDNDFVANKYFVTFVVDYMNVLIEVDASLQKPTFEEISILVKPRFESEDLDATERKQCQVDLANDLVERLLKLWNKVCPGVEYEQKVIWPWPASSSKPKDEPERNVEVAEVKKWVQERGVGTKMQWVVGSGDPITEDQLLSTKDKLDVVQSVEHSLSVVMQGIKEAVNLRIFPPDVLTDEVWSDEIGVAADAIDMPTSSTHEEQDELNNKLKKLLSMKLKPIHNKMDKMYKKLGNVENLVRDGFGEVLKKQKELLHKLQDTEKMFLEDKQSISPKFIYLGTSDSAWVTLKDALSLSKTVRLHFACEAGYDNYRPHADVKNQQGLDISQLKDWARIVLPWLKVSLTVLFISAKVAANLVAPGLGLIIPSFLSDWQQTTTLSDGLELATGFSKDQLEKTFQGTGIDASDAHGDPQGLYRKSRNAVSELLGKLKPKEFEEKIGLRKVRLNYYDGSLHGVVWICTGCFEKFPAEIITEL